MGSEEQRAAEWEMANGPTDFRAEAQRLMKLLPSAEARNFVQLRLARDESSTRDPRPLLGAEVWFKRDAVRTLAKYTNDPRFFAKAGGATPKELDPIRDTWVARLQPLGIASGLSSNPIRGVVEVGLGVTEARFRAIATRHGWTWGDEVEFRYAEEQPSAFRDLVLSTGVRAFPREAVSPGSRKAALGTGRIVIEDGCFRLGTEGSSSLARPLVMFAYDAQLALDPGGYLVVVRVGEDKGYRIGEMGAWNAPNHVDESWPDVAKLRAACGQGPIVNVAIPQSLRTYALPDPRWVLDYAEVRGMSYEAAWREITGCMAGQESRGRQGLETRNACVTQFNRGRYKPRE